MLTREFRFEKNYPDGEKAVLTVNAESRKEAIKQIKWSNVNEDDCDIRMLSIVEYKVLNSFQNSNGLTYYVLIEDETIDRAVVWNGKETFIAVKGLRQNEDTDTWSWAYGSYCTSYFEARLEHYTKCLSDAHFSIDIDD